MDPGPYKNLDRRRIQVLGHRHDSIEVRCLLWSRARGPLAGGIMEGWERASNLLSCGPAA